MSKKKKFSKNKVKSFEAEISEPSKRKACLKENVKSQTKEQKLLSSSVLPYESLWRPIYPFMSHYLNIGGFLYHYLDENPQTAEISGRDSVNQQDINQQDVRQENIDLLTPPIKQKNEQDNEEKNQQAISDTNLPDTVLSDTILPNAFSEEPETLLLVHGNPTWSFYWRRLIQEFRKNCRVIAVDHIGCGLSEKPSENDYPFTLERRISDLSTFIRKLNLKKITLLAHDWGGAIGMGAAAKMPGRFSRFVLFNTGAFRSLRCPYRIRVCRTPILGRFLLQNLNLFSRAALRMATTNPQTFPKDVAAGLLAPYDSWEHRTAVYRFVQDIPLSKKHPSYEALAKVEEGLALFREHPVSLIWGMQDWCFSPEFLKRFIQFFPDADVHRLTKAGHYVVEDAFDEIVPILQHFFSRFPIT